MILNKCCLKLYLLHMLTCIVIFTLKRLGLPWWLRWYKRLPAMQETRVRFLGREDPLEKEMAIHSSTLAWKIP